MSHSSWKDKIRYRIDRYFQSGFAFQLFVASILVIAILLVFVAISEVFHLQPGVDFDVDNTGQFWPSVRFWWVLTHTLDTYWIERSLPEQLVATLLMLFNLLVFAAVVGLAGSKIQERLENMNRGTSKAIEEGHVVILGWSEKIIPIIRELYAGMEQRKMVVAILCERPMEEVERKMRKTFRGYRKLRIVIRQGSISSVSDLELVAVQSARSVIILREQQSGWNGDAQVVKSIMAIAHSVTLQEEQAAMPFIVAEIERDDTAPLARAAADGVSLILVQPVDALGKIILQTARQPGLVHIYNELLKHEGSEVHTAPASKFPKLIGRSWSDVAGAFPTALPIGIKRDGAVQLVPHATAPDTTLRTDDTIYFIARDSDALRRVSIVALPEAKLPETRIVHNNVISNMLVIGFNEKTLPLLREYNAYATSMGTRFSLTLVSPFPVARETLDHLVFPALDVSILDEDYLLPGMLERIDPSAFDSIVVLSEIPEDGTWEDADTRVIMTLLLLRNMRRQAEEAGIRHAALNQVVGEILHVYNKDLAESAHTLRDVIISQELISKMIAQICRDPNVEGALLDFFDEQGVEIYLKPLAQYTGKNSVPFGEVFAASLKLGETAIGIMLADASLPESERIRINPSKQELFSLHPDTRVIVLAERE